MIKNFVIDMTINIVRGAGLFKASLSSISEDFDVSFVTFW